MSATKVRNKVKKSYSLSTSSMIFIRQVQKERKLRSASQTLDTLLEDMRAKLELERLATEQTAYYDSLTDDEIAQDRDWGNFAAQTLLRTTD